MENSKPYVVMVIVLLVFLVGMMGLFWYIMGRTKSPATQTISPTLTNNASASNTNTTNVVSNNAANVTNVTQNNTNTSQAGGKTSNSGNITVSTPKDGDKVGLAITISGFARVFENVVNMRVKDDAGNILATGFTTANSPDVGKTGPFSKTLTITAIPASKKGFVEVYDLSAADGSIEDLISTPIVFQ